MSNTALIVIGAIVLVALVASVLLMRKPQSVSLSPTAPLPVAKPAPKAKPEAVTREGHGIADSAAAAILDMATPVIGVDAHPDMPSDDLTRIKGLGPKAATVLNGLGINRYSQLAALDPAQAAELDASMGAFKGRIDRDRWIEQARFLEQGDIAGFEAQFGKLGLSQPSNSTHPRHGGEFLHRCCRAVGIIPDRARYGDEVGAGCNQRRRIVGRDPSDRH